MPWDPIIQVTEGGKFYVGDIGVTVLTLVITVFSSV